MIEFAAPTQNFITGSRGRNFERLHNFSNTTLRIAAQLFVGVDYHWVM
jgi:hypothetical protein